MTITVRLSAIVIRTKGFLKLFQQKKIKKIKMLASSACAIWLAFMFKQIFSSGELFKGTVIYH